jgi:uncharacterized protein (TIGR02271 family)
VTASGPPRDPDERGDAALVRHEEELELRPSVTEGGRVRARKIVGSERVGETFPRAVEEADVERVAPGEGDSGEIETLPDGSISIPLLEEELVVSKRLVVRERVIIRKRTVTEETRVEEELRKERIEVEDDVGPG